MTATTPDDIYRRQREYELTVQQQMESLELRICEFVDGRIAVSHGKTDRDVRMDCLSLFVKEKSLDPMACCALLREIDKLAEYVLTGKKPGEA